MRLLGKVRNVRRNRKVQRMTEQEAAIACGKAYWKLARMAGEEKAYKNRQV